MVKNSLSPLIICWYLVLAIPVSAFGQSPNPQQDQVIKDKLAAPPLFLDEQHPGPTMVPKDLPKGIFPFDCRATEAYLHRVRPGEYHFQRAQRLLGQGIDVIGCEAFGLERFEQVNSEFGRVDQAVFEAEATVASPFGTEQWRPGALTYILMSAYKTAAKTYIEAASKEHSASYLERGNGYSRKLAPLEKQSDEPANQSIGKRADAEKGHITKVKLLLANGAQLGAKDKLGRAALQYARPPRNDHDDEFPQCYETLSSDTLKPTNDCAGTRKLLKQAASK